MNHTETPHIDRSQAPRRYQSVYWKVVEITDLSGFVEESTSVSAPDIDVISASKLFRSDEVVLGIGRPNVFLLVPDEKGNHVRFAAKSCWRGESKLERTMGVVQSGVFFILQNLSGEQIANIRESAKKHEWEKNITCVNANAKVLNDAGITLWNDGNLDDIYLPMSIFRAIEKHGLKANGILLDIEKAKTTARYLEEQALQINKAVWLTFVRHAKRFFSGWRKKKTGKDPTTESAPNRAPVVAPSIGKTGLTDLELQVSNPSRVVVPLRIMWGPHTVFTLNQDRVDIDEYLPETLQAYPQENPPLMTRIKKNILFNRYVVAGINRLMQNRTSRFAGKSESDIHNMFEVHSEEKLNRYNIVASGSGMMIAKIDIRSKVADWILSKHVLISNYHESVRFAGEIWKDSDGIIWINDNSGTYMPRKEQLKIFVEYLREVFPNVDIRACYE